MAWRCSGNSNASLIKNLETSNILTIPKVIQAFLQVDRGNYAPQQPYQDSPQVIGYNATISAPHMHAFAVEQLCGPASVTNSRILDVGCGSGYLATVFARLNPTAKVYAIDYIPELVKLSEMNIRKADGDLLSSERIILSVGDGWEGLPQVAPFDVIHVGAAAASMPRALLTQLKLNGRMIIPIGPVNGNQELYLVERISDVGNFDSMFRVQSLMGVRYVPLVKTS